VKLGDGKLETVALFKGVLIGCSRRFGLEGCTQSVQPCEYASLVGIILVSSHTEKREILTWFARSVRGAQRGRMGIRERQHREREAIRHDILDAARSLFLAEGYVNVSMRKIADQIEYSPGAIYSYFPGKDDIFLAIGEEGLQQLRTYCAMSGNGSPLEKVRDAFWRFYTFSKAQPEYFALIFIDRTVSRISRDWEQFSSMRELREEIEQEIQHGIDEGLFPGGESAAQIFLILWTAMYGAAVFRLSHRLSASEDADALATEVLETTLAGLQCEPDVRASMRETHVNNHISHQVEAPRG
jgi:AcrR family transcriptional regulator